jgi:sporulation integral membrane protein YlbJ
VRDEAVLLRVAVADEDAPVLLPLRLLLLPLLLLTPLLLLVLREDVPSLLGRLPFIISSLSRYITLSLALSLLLRLFVFCFLRLVLSATDNYPHKRNFFTSDNPFISHIQWYKQQVGVNMKLNTSSLYLYIIATILIFFNAIILIFPKEILSAAKNGLLLWYNNVLPSLFSFMVFTSMLVYTGFPDMLGRLCSPLCKRLFKISGTGAFALVIGIISGCPLGAKTACDLYTSGKISRSEAQRLVMYCNNTGPLFVIGVVGEGLLHSKEIGIKLLLIQYISAVIVGIVSGITAKDKYISVPSSVHNRLNLFQALSSSVSSAVSSVTLIGGFITLFSVINTILKCCGVFSLLGQGSEGIISGILEVTNGTALLARADKPNYPLICAIISWGGLSIHAQSSAFLCESSLSVKKYLLGKLAQAITSYFICVALCSFLLL